MISIWRSGRRTVEQTRIIEISTLRRGVAIHLPRLLRARCQRPRCRAAEKGDDLVSFQPIELHLEHQPGRRASILN